MIPETKANAVVAELALHPLIQARFDGLIPLIDAKDWLEGIAQIVGGGSSLTSVCPTSDVLAVAAVASGEKEEELEAMAAQLHLPFRSFGDPTEEQLAKWVVGAALSRAREASVDAAHSRISAATLRRDLDRQQQAFHALENAVQDFGMPQYTQALDLPLGGERLQLSGADCPASDFRLSLNAVGKLSQRLPLSARKIAAVDLHIDLIDNCSPDGVLEVSICDLAGYILIKPVCMEIAELTPGWNRFRFEEGIECTDRDAILNLSMTGKGAVALSLAPCVPLERFHPHSGDAAPLGDSPVATRVWRGLSGVRTQLPLAAKPQGPSIRLRSGEVPRARLHSWDGDPPDFDVIQYWPVEDGFLVHPPALGMTVAVIEGLDLQNLISATAIVNNAHRDGPNISFSLGIVPSNQVFHIPEVLGPWLTLPPMGWGEVHAALPEAASGEFDIVIATMIRSEQGNDKAWGLFRGFHLNFDAP